jgi:hypothetical protein
MNTYDLPVIDYGKRRRKALKWLGVRYLLARPVPRREPSSVMRRSVEVTVNEHDALGAECSGVGAPRGATEPMHGKVEHLRLRAGAAVGNHRRS